MKILRLLQMILALCVIIAISAACGSGSYVHENTYEDAYDYDYSHTGDTLEVFEDEEAEPEIFESDEPGLDEIEPEQYKETIMRNFVDKRLELVSLVFRLAGRPGHMCLDTAFQRGLESYFGAYRSHPIVVYLERYPTIAFDAAIKMAVHLEKTEDQFILIDNIDYLVSDPPGLVRWTRDNAPRFVDLLNDFYIDIGFAEFFENNMDYFLSRSLRFYEALYNRINFYWFARHGLNPDNLRVVLHAGGFRGGFGSRFFCTVHNEIIAYSVIPAGVGHRWFQGIIHEFAHSIGNPLAAIWYYENEEFRRWANDAVDPVRLPFYAMSMIMAYEYVTRAFEILYFKENTDENWRLMLMQNRFAGGFPYIEYVFAMVVDHRDSNLIDA